MALHGTLSARMLGMMLGKIAGNRPPISPDWNAALLGLDVLGTLTVQEKWQDLPAVRVVFQGAGVSNVQYTTGTGQKRMIRAHVIPYDPKTTAQIARRDKMRAAVAAWHALSDVQKQAWKPSASNRRITAFNAYVSAQMLA